MSRSRVAFYNPHLAHWPLKELYPIKQVSKLLNNSIQEESRIKLMLANKWSRPKSCKNSICEMGSWLYTLSSMFEVAC